MLKHKKLACSIGAATAMVGALALAPVSVATATTGWTVTPVLHGLNSPRGVAFDGLGDMYLAEAGFAPGPGSGLTTSGAVSKYTLGAAGPSLVWSTPFSSVYTSEHGSPETIGPDGLSAMGSGCQKNSHGDRQGCQVLTILGESASGLAQAAPGVAFPEMGRLFRVNGADGQKSVLADVGDFNYAWSGDHSALWNEFPDANPYGVLVTKGGDGGIRTFVADAASNTISEVMRDGTQRIVSYIPNETFVAHRDSTPTCIAQGPDGMLYVGTLDLASNFAGGHKWSSVWRVDPNSTDWLHNATVWASGLTTITSCTFDSAGNFWAAEMFAPQPAGPPGDLAVIPFDHPSAVSHVSGVPLPGGVAQGPDGAMYATTFSPDAHAGHGGLVKVTSA